MCQTFPTYEQRPCPHGWYCSIDTLNFEACNNGREMACPERCPSGVYPRWPILAWSLGVHCPEAHVTSSRGLLRLQHMDSNALLSSFLCYSQLESIQLR